MSLRPFGGRGFYDPYHEINRLLDEMMGGTAGPARRSGRQQGAATEWAPAVDALTKDADLVIRAELPGVKLEDVDISLHDNVLTISGERRAEQEEEQRGGYHIRERRHGSFRRTVALPEGIDESKISARYEDGVLEVRVQGAAVAREPKRIQIEAAGGQQGATDVEVSGVLGREATTTPTTATARPEEGTQGAAPPPGDVPPETPPETRAR